MDFEIWFKVHTNVSNFETASSKNITLYISYQFCDNRKIPSCTYYLKEAEMKIPMFAHFKNYHGDHNNTIPGMLQIKTSLNHQYALIMVHLHLNSLPQKSGNLSHYNLNVFHTCSSV